MIYFKNKFNENLFQYPTEKDRVKHQERMDENSFETFREWESIGLNGRTHYFCEFKEIAKA